LNALCSLLSSCRVIKDDVEVFDAHLCALWKEAGDVPSTQVQFYTEIFGSVGTLLKKLGEFLVGPHMVLAFLFLENLEHGHVLLDKASVLFAKLPNLAKGLAAECNEFKDVED